MKSVGSDTSRLLAFWKPPYTIAYPRLNMARDTPLFHEILFWLGEVVYPRTISPEPNFPIKEISNLVSQPKVVKASFMRLAETYQDRNISSIAFPRFFEPNLFNDGAEIQKICNDFLSRLSIPTVVYTDYIPHSKTLIPLITKLVGVLSEEEKK